MPATLTCDCGARFEVEDLAAGQSAPCPECKSPVRAPGRPAAPLPRNSLLALVSLVLALGGAFTAVGGALAALLGLYALFDIRRHPDLLTGHAYALAAVALGPLLAALTLGGYLAADALPFDGWVRAWALAGQLEPLPAPEVAAGNGEITLTAPSPAWRKVRGGKTAHPIVGELQPGCDVLLFEPRRNAFLDLTRVAAAAAPKREELSQWLTKELTKERPPLIGDDEDDFGRPVPRAVPPTVGAATELPPVGETTVQERPVVIRRGASAWRFLVRTYHRPGAALWVVRAYAPARRFEAAEAELRQALDSVRFPQ